MALCLKAIDQLVLTQAMDGAGRGGQRCDQDQPRCLGRIGVAVGGVDLFDFGVAAVGDVVRDGRAQRGVDGANLRGDFVHIEVDVEGADQVLGVRLVGLPPIGHHHRPLPFASAG